MSLCAAEHLLPPCDRMAPCAPCWPPRRRACPPATGGSTRSSGTACGCSPTSATGRLVLTSRNERDVTASFPELAALRRAYDDMLLDGEVVALDGGRPSFAALAERMHVQDRRKAERLATTRPVTLMVFDLLRLFGSDLTAQPLVGPARAARAARPRRPALAGARPSTTTARSCSGHPGAGPRGRREQAAYLALPAAGAARRTGSSRRTAPRLSVVVGGWRPEKTNDAGRLGAVLVGLPDGAGAGGMPGRVGSGHRRRRRSASWRSCWRPFACRSSPFCRRGARHRRPWRDLGRAPRSSWRRRVLELTRDGTAAPAGIPRGAHGPEPERPRGGRRC